MIVRQPGTVFMLHRVSAAAVEPGHYSPITISPERLRTEFDKLGEHSKPSWDDVAAGRVRRDWILATFDDGFRDTFETALPILEAYGVHAVVFVTVDFVAGHQEAFYAYAARMLSGRGQVTVRAQRFDASTAEGFEQAFRHACAVLDRGSRARRWARLEAIARENGIDVPEKSSGIYMSWAEVAELARHPLVTIGAHTWTHPRLSRSSPSLFKTELYDARREIERHVGLPVRSLAYPHGANNGLVRAAARLAGYRYAFSTENATLAAGQRLNPMAIPRMELK